MTTTHQGITDSKTRQALEKIKSDFVRANYICDDDITMAIHLARSLAKPILVEGPPGVGKTELARAASLWAKLPLIRLQCYEGLDESKTLYEWQYGKQLLYTQILKEQLHNVLGAAKDFDASLARLHNMKEHFFSKEFLLARPLLQALEAPKGAVLLIDEVDKSDGEFEAFLLEFLSEYQLSIPEIGLIKAKIPPLVFLTSNNRREIGDALKRRCLHLHIDFPSFAHENAIIAAQAPELAESLREALVHFVQGLRKLELKKPPSISETIDWAKSLVLLNVQHLDEALVRTSLNVLLKFRSDIEIAQSETPALLRDAVSA